MFPSIVKRTLAMLPPTFAIMLDTLAYDPMILPRTSMEAIAAGVEVMPVSPLPSPTKNPAFMYAPVVMFPSIVKRTLAMLPPTFAIIFETLAYDPMMFPLLSPIMKDDTTLPRTLICPLTATLPPRNTTLAMLPPTFEIMLETLAYDPMMLPLLSPIMKDDTTLPRTLIWPLTATLPPRNTTFPMLPPTFEIMLETLAYDPMMLPRTSVVEIAAGVEVMPVSPLPSPTKNPAFMYAPVVTFPSIVKRTLAMLPPTFEIMLETLAYDPMILPRMSDDETAGGVKVAPVRKAPFPTKYCSVIMFPEAYISSKLLFHGVRK
ncbi:hypothetical protein MT325_m153L [Paramecium bursaria chlorella virus MT325]|uniref:Uncharacterized protein m153L n=1 Tax=Paramecium bursaria Chlorella virus MT325 TaxID=346932 RepID=A7ITN3_PBCVM|nr:hypothetical protein MT325_m153L [Paramecium bursaria chlorella virus MT325]